ncbi:MAG TPA: EamA family transporter [Candidatus Nanopelagicales bacterium]|nr:EamA family transporter [Candidatus Nanopelagicales bacterium]
MTVTTAPPEVSQAQVWTSLSLVYVIWGSTYLAIAVTVESAPPMQSMGMRFLAASALLALFIVVRRGPAALRVSRRQVASSATVGFLLLVCGMGGLAYAERHVPTGVAALIVAGIPVWIVILRAVTGDRPRPLTWLGVLVGLLGLAVLLLPGSSGGASLGWSLLILSGSACWAVGSFLQPRLDTPSDPLVLTLYQMLTGGVMLMLGGALLHERWNLAALTASSIWSWVYLVTIGSLVGYVAYVWLVGHAPLSLVSTYAYVNPVVAVALGVLLHGESLTGAIIAGGAIVVLGVVLVVTAERKVHPAAADVPECAT